MSLTRTLLAGATAFGLTALPAFADAIEVHDAYARISGAAAKSGAAFMQIVNSGAEDDRLIGVATEAAMKAELHTHKAGADGVMQMRHVPEGLAVPAGATHALARGGDHVMLMGLTRPLAQGDDITLILTFEKAGEITLDLPVDNDHETAGDGHHGH